MLHPLNMFAFPNFSPQLPKSGQICCGLWHCSALMRTIRSLFHAGGGVPPNAVAQKVGQQKNGGAVENVVKTSTHQQPIEMVKTTDPPSAEGSLDGWSEAQVLKWEPNDYEKELVKRTWSDDFDFLYELGAAIYDYIFEHNPQTKQLFPKIHRHGDQWRQSADFRSQALKFVQTLAYAAKNLCHMDECLQPLLFAIGERHVQYASRGFRPEHWNIVLDAMEQALTGHIRSLNDFTAQQRLDATRTWRRLAHFIIANMKKGYLAREAAEAMASEH
uniref:Globin family profile domain-containing protein n=1 Tax=Globodera rostochiensis TaxID=31243 RepID=A0A914GWB4_GLORO